MRSIALKITAIVVSLIISLSFLTNVVYSTPQKLAGETIFKNMSPSGSMSEGPESKSSLAPLPIGETRFSAGGLGDALIKQEKNRVDTVFSTWFLSIVFTVIIISFMSRIHENVLKRFRLLI